MSKKNPAVATQFQHAMLRKKRNEQASNPIQTTPPQKSAARTTTESNLPALTTKPTTPNSSEKDSVPVRAHERPLPKQQKNINDPSYRETSQPPSRFKGEKPGGTVSQQMTEAATQSPDQLEKTRTRQKQRIQDRQSAVQTGAITERREHGNVSAFTRGTQIQHRRDGQGKPTQQESGRLTGFSANPRPGQRKHPSQS